MKKLLTGKFARTVGAILMDVLPLGTHLKQEISKAKETRDWFRVTIGVALAVALAAGFIGVILGKVSPDTMKSLIELAKGLN